MEWAMPRQRRVAPGGYVNHALNRAVARLPLFEKDGDFDAFERVLVEGMEKQPMRLLAYCLMVNHWHFVLWPDGDDDMTEQSAPVRVGQAGGGLALVKLMDTIAWYSC